MELIEDLGDEVAEVKVLWDQGEDSPENVLAQGIAQPLEPAEARAGRGYLIAVRLGETIGCIGYEDEPSKVDEAEEGVAEA